MQKEYLIELGDAVVAVKNADGQIKLNQLINLTAAGAASGALWGTLAGLIFLMPLVGTAIGAASGALGARLTDVGINDQFMKDAAGALQPGTAGLFLLIRKMTTDKVLADLRGVGGTVIRTSFDESKEEALRKALAQHAEADVNPAPAARCDAAVSRSEPREHRPRTMTTESATAGVPPGAIAQHSANNTSRSAVERCPRSFVCASRKALAARRPSARSMFRKACSAFSFDE